jgi:hypothetical protein
MQHVDEAHLRQLRLRVQEELFQTRADVERANRSLTDDPDLDERLEEIERELAKLQGSHGLLFRGRRRREVLGLLLSERLLLDDLGFDSYADYLSEGVQAGLLDSDDGSAHAKRAPLELAEALQRLTDIENGVLDLDWLENGRREPSLFERPEVGAASAARLGDRSAAADPVSSAGRGAGSVGASAPLVAWRNPFAVDAQRSTTTRPPSKLPRLHVDGSPPVDLPYWDETGSA